MRIASRTDSISSREEFIALVRELSCSLKEDPNSWENDSLETFLNGLAAWVEDMEGYYQNRGEEAPDQPTWKVLGQMLLAATVYE